jgi:hypothetical protein
MLSRVLFYPFSMIPAWNTNFKGRLSTFEILTKLARFALKAKQVL